MKNCKNTMKRINRDYIKIEWLAKKHGHYLFKKRPNDNFYHLTGLIGGRVFCKNKIKALLTGLKTGKNVSSEYHVKDLHKYYGKWNMTLNICSVSWNK